MITEKLTVTHKGWFGFCPVWFTEDINESMFDPMPIPRHVPDWMIDLSAFVMDMLPINGYIMTCRPLSKPKTIIIKDCE